MYVPVAQVAPAGAEKEGVRRQRSLHVPSTLPAGFHRWLDFRFFLAAPEKTVLACVGIDAADTDTWMGESSSVQGLLRTSDGAFDQTGLDPFDSIHQADVGRDMDHPELRGGEHH